MGGIVYWSVGTLFSSGVLLIQRLLVNLKNKVLTILLYLLILILLAMPGMVIGVMLEDLPGQVAGYLLCAVWNVLAAAVITAACRNLLNTIDV